MTEKTRRASEAPFPYGWPGRVLYMEQRGGGVEQLDSRDELRAALRRALSNESVLLAAWPGKYRTDLFIIDKPDELASAINL